MVFEKNPDRVEKPAEVKIIWSGGPSRRWSEERCPQATLPLETGGYSGMYVCQRCNEAVIGVYRVFSIPQTRHWWICGGCREFLTVRTPRKSAA